MRGYAAAISSLMASAKDRYVYDCDWLYHSSPSRLRISEEVLELVLHTGVKLAALYTSSACRAPKEHVSVDAVNLVI